MTTTETPRRAGEATGSIIAFVKKFKADNGRLPTVVQVQEHMGYNTRMLTRQMLRKCEAAIGKMDVRVMCDEDSWEQKRLKGKRGR